MKKISLVFIFSLLLSVVSWGQLSSFAHKYELLITNTTNTDITNKQVLVTLPGQTWLTAGKIKSSADDLRFSSDCDGVNILSHFQEDATISDDTFKVWILCDLIPANSSKSVFVFTGDISAVSTSDIDLVFPFTEQLVITDTIDPIDQPGLADGTYSSIVIESGGAIVSSAPVDGQNNIILNAERVIVKGSLNVSGAGYDGSIISTDLGPGSPASGFGGGGASYAVSGGASDAGTAPGAVYALPTQDTIQMGSAGGGGELIGLINIGLPGSYGGNGGGAIAITAQLILLAPSATLSASGQDGEDAPIPAVGLTTNFTASAAGGGAAGGILLNGVVVQSSAEISAVGGNGGNTSQSEGSGGGGAGGIVKVFGDLISDANTYDLNGGNGGTAAGITASNGMTGVVTTGVSFLNDINKSLSGELTSTVSLTNSVTGLVCPTDTIIYAASTGFPNYEFFLDEGTGFVSVQNSGVETFEYLNPKDGAKVYVYGYTSGGCFAFSDTLSVTVTPATTADFTFTQNDLEVRLTETSTNATSIEYSMGDGKLYTLGDTVHMYAAEGIYDIQLIAFGLCNNDTVVQSVDVKCAAFDVDFNFAVTGLSADFTQNGLGKSIIHSWTFGDGGTSNLENPSHTYAVNGTYDVQYIGENACGIKDTVLIPVDLNCPPPSPDFSFAFNGYEVIFSELATGETSYAWDFGDGNTSTDANPTNNYGVEGTFDVVLAVTNACGTQDIMKQVVLVCPKPLPVFDFNITAYTVDFTLATSDHDSLRWDFGDGNTSIIDSPTHTYTFEDDFIVMLTAFNICGSTTIKDTVTINCPLPAAAYTFSFNENQYQFVSTSTGADNINWDFGGLATSTVDTVDVTFPNSGIFNVCLEATNGCGSKQLCQNINVSCITTTTILLSQSAAGFTFSSLDSLAQYSWNFGDGTTSTEAIPTHRFTNTSDQEYTICLNGLNACGDPISEICETFFITDIVNHSSIEVLSIYPNPVLNVLNIKGYTGKVYITTLDGKIVWEGFTNGFVNVESLGSGIYFIKAQKENKLFQARFIK